MTASAPSKILAIDCVRFACAILVMAFHFGAAFPLSAQSAAHLIDPSIVLPGGLAPMSWFGWVGVEIFFVVSGYVIALSAEGMATRAFLRRRVLRLAPAAWVCASLTAIVVIVSGNVPIYTVLARWLAAIVFYPLPAPIDGSYWTLSIELCFYLLVAACLARDGVNTHRIEAIGRLLGIASALYWAFVLAAGWSTAEALENMVLNLSLLPYGIFLATGITLSAVRGTGATVIRLITVLTFVAIGSGVVAFHASSMANVPGLVTNPIAPVTTFIAAIAIIIAAPWLQRPLESAIGAPRLATIGLMTYPLYLLHQTIGAGLIVLLVRLGVPGYGAMAVAAITIIALAWIVTRIIEPPLRRWLAARIPATAPVRERHAPAPDTRPIAFPPAG